MGQEINVMENEILREESLPAPQQEKAPIKKKPKGEPIARKLTEKARNFVSSFRGPKIITIFILFMSLVTVYLALVLVSANFQKETKPQEAPAIPSEKPQPTPDVELERYRTKVKDFNQRVESMNRAARNLEPPKVDFVIEFEKP